MAYDLDPSQALNPPVSPRCFMHIPKSAGTSIHGALEIALPAGSLAPQRMDTSPFCAFRDFELLPPPWRALIAVEDADLRSMRSYRAVSGHFSLTTLLQIAPSSAIGTILREPRTRTLSLYMYWRTPRIFDEMQPYSTQEYALGSLERFLAEPRVASAVDNQVCRTLLNGDTRIPDEGFIAEADVEDVASDAIRRLETLGFVGVLELGDSAWRGLARLFHVSLEPRRLRVTGESANPVPAAPGEKLLTANALDLVERRNAADRIVYDHALTLAGIRGDERLRLVESTFANQLVRLGDLLGSSAAERAQATKRAHAEIERQERLTAEITEVRARLGSREQTMLELSEELERRSEDIDRLRRWLDAVHVSVSWRLTAPLRSTKHGMERLLRTHRTSAIPVRNQSLVPGWSVRQVWWFAVILCSIIATTDAVLRHVVLIPMLTVGPVCGVFTGRLTKTATSGIWALTLAMFLGLPDEILGTEIQLTDLVAILAVMLPSLFIATFIERRRNNEIQ